MLDLVSDGIETGRGTRAAYVHHDRVNGELRGRKGARLAALTSGGAIPELGDFRVIAEPDETLIGSVNEDWATESMAGDVFILGTHHWQIRQVTGGEVRVVDAGDEHPTIPFWRGEAPARTVELSEEVARIRSRGRAGDRATTTWPGRSTRSSSWPASSATPPPRSSPTWPPARAVLGVMPTQDDLVIERFFDESGGMQLVVHSPYGGRLNRAMGYALRKKFCAGFNFELQASANDDAIVISLGPHHSFPLADVPRFLSVGVDPGHAAAGHPRPADLPEPLAVEPQPEPRRPALPRRRAGAAATSSGCRATTCSPPCSPAPPPARRTSPARSRCPTTRSPARRCTTASPRRSTATG